MVKACFLDRDGTINKLIHGRPDPKHVGPWKFEEFEYIQGVPEAVYKIKGLGYTIHVVTNQPDADDGLMTHDELAKMHKKLAEDLNVETIQAAFTRGTDEYKPNSGMLENIIKKWNVTRERSWMIGDSWKDVVAGHNAGVKTIYLGGIWEPPKKYSDIFPIYFANDLLEASKIIEQNEAGK